MSKIIDGIVKDLKAIPGNLKSKSGSVDGKKLLLMNLPYILVGYLCDKIAYLWRVSQGGNASDKLLATMNGLNKLFHNPLPSLFPKDIVIGAGCGVALRIIVYFKMKNAKKFRQGVEYGSARWGNMKDIEPYVDPVFENNVILTETETLMMSSRPMLLLIGNGGEGKSRVGLVMRSILGDNMNICSIDKLSQDRFCRADQEGKLLMVDDDSQMEALKNTNILKAVITMEDKMDLETKGMKSYQGYLYVRIMAFGNGSLTSLYDASDGFYRRQIVLKVRDKNPNRKDDKDLAKKLREENEGIALWALEGLNRLAVNGFHFTVSDRALQNMEDNKKSDVNLLQFIESEGYLHFQSDGEITTKEFYEIYMQWCEDNLEKPRAQNTFSSYFKDHGREYGLTEKKNVKNNGGKYVRGFKGVCKHIGSNPFENAA